MLSNNRRIAKNSLLLYIRTFIILLISLYTSRVILQALGVEDYGIYNVVGGFVAMFSLLSGSLSNAISRYITFELGRGNKERLKEVFSTSVTVQILLSLLVIVFAEIVGVWFLNVKMNIPEDRMFAANCVFQCSLLTFAINLISIPYNACIIAHEKMNIFAYVSILETLLKLGAVLFLFIVGNDRLIVYAIFLVIIAALIRFFYGVYCGRVFDECHYHFNLNKPLIKEMTSLAGWNILGSGSSILNSHGINIIINLFFGVKVNAARGLSTQVNTAVRQFIDSFTTAVNPQITKTYAQDNKDYSFKLVMMSSKYSFFLLLLLAAPLIAETPFILQLWLKDVPEYTVLFVRLTLISTLVVVPSNSLYTLALATGNIKKYQIVVGSLSLSVFFISFVLYKLGMPVETEYYIKIGVYIVMLFSRLVIVSSLTGLSIKKYIQEVIGKSCFVLFVVVVSILMFLSLFPFANWLHASIVVSFSFVITFLAIYFVGLSEAERQYFFSMIKKANRL